MMTHRFRTLVLSSLLASSLAACGSEAVTPADSGMNVTPDANPPQDVEPPPEFNPWTPPPGETGAMPAGTDGQWRFVRFPDSACGNGTPAGIGLNTQTGAQDLVIFLMGGGGCWDGITCLGVGTAANLRVDYTDTVFRAEIGQVGGMYIFNRAAMDNPFRAANFVYVPYCTGDIHGGNNVRDYTWGQESQRIYHVGAKNMEAYLRRLVMTFPNARTVWLMGVSAGGYGAGVHWWRVQQAFPNATVHLLDDSGPPITPPDLRWSQLKAAWNIQFPPGCTGCASDLNALIRHYIDTMGTRRMGLISYTQDRTISGYFSITGADFEMRLRGLQTSFGDRPNFRYYVRAGDNHVMLQGARPTGGITAADGTVLFDWVRRWATDGAGWNNVAP